MKPVTLHLLLIPALICGLVGCATLQRNPVPLDRIHDAEVVNAPGVRAFGGTVSEIFQKDIVLSLQQEGPDDFVNPATGAKSYSALALSGGGSHGAFGAGFLYGWSKKGDRPEFKLVTGISTGALIAPFAFLGPGYDEKLREVYTTINTASIVKKLSIFSILTESESFTSSGPLEHLIKSNTDASLLTDVANEHRRGRRLYIGTTHMDAQKLVVWNMGLIAEIGTDEALQLFRDILLASASIPTVMPPVYFSVEVDGEIYDEMHTDGGTVTQVFFHSGTLDLAEAGKEAGIEIGENTIGTLYVIRNGQLGAETEHTPRKIQSISSRAVDTMIKAAALNNIFRMYVLARRDQSNLYYVDIPDDYSPEGVEPFDADEMKRLFNIGFELGVSSDPWARTMPIAEVK